MAVNPKFVGAGERASYSDFVDTAALLGVEVAAFQAVVDVEARAEGYFSSGAPIMLPERHIAYARTRGAVRDQLVRAGLAYPKWGTKKYPRSGDARYAMLDQMIAVCGDKAYEFCSFGLPQMMGFNYAACGYSSAVAMFGAFKQSERAQLQAMARFIAAGPKMHAALKRRDWATFARHYNGPGYRKNRYDDKLDAAYRRRAAAGGVSASPGALDDGYLSIGDKGEAVRNLQESLNHLGFGPLAADGDFGRLTATAVAEYQESRGLGVDGKAGLAETLPRISADLESQKSDAPVPAVPSAEVVAPAPEASPGPIPAAVAAADPPYSRSDMPDAASPIRSGKLWRTVTNSAGSVAAGSWFTSLTAHPYGWYIIGGVVGVLLATGVALVLVFREQIRDWVEEVT